MAAAAGAGAGTGAGAGAGAGAAGTSSVKFLVANTACTFKVPGVDRSATGSELKALALQHWPAEAEIRVESPDMFRIICMGKAVHDNTRLQGAGLLWWVGCAAPRWVLFVRLCARLAPRVSCSHLNRHPGLALATHRP